MIWLATQMWALLIAAFALGLAIGAWMRGARSRNAPRAPQNADLEGSLAVEPEAPAGRSG